MSSPKIDVCIEGRHQVIERLIRAVVASLESQTPNLAPAQLALLRAAQTSRWAPERCVVTIEHAQATELGGRLTELARSYGLGAEARVSEPTMQFVLEVSSLGGGSGNPTFATIDVTVDLAQRIVAMSEAVKAQGWHEVSSSTCGNPVFWDSERGLADRSEILPKDCTTYQSDADVMVVAERYVKWQASSRYGSSHFQTEHVPLDDLRKFVAAHSQPNNSHTVTSELRGPTNGVNGAVVGVSADGDRNKELPSLGM